MTSLALHPDRLFPADPSTREVARRLYDSVKELPIISPHSHVPPEWISDDIPFRDPASLLITPDHYVTRLLHAHGVPLQELGVGQGDLDEDASSMSYRIALVGPEVYGRGYGTEATRLVRDFAFGPLRLHRLALEVNSFNHAAIAVYERAGFVREGVRRDAIRHEGRWHDVLDMALLESDPRP